jgi:cation transport ATPase-like protein
VTTGDELRSKLSLSPLIKKLGDNRLRRPRAEALELHLQHAAARGYRGPFRQTGCRKHVRMAGVSLFLPFLPLLSKKILLTNLLTDFPEMTIATDNVDSEMVEYPRRRDIKVIRKFMMTFGLVSSLFAHLTFVALLLVFHATQDQFRTGWFVESVSS